MGLPRSGTTLMRSLVTGHPRIAIAPETHFLRKFGTSSSDSEFEELWRMYSETFRFRDLGLDGDDIKRRVIESGDRSARNTFRMVLREFAMGQGKDRWGEKTPSHYGFLHELFEWFAQARVIWVVRDPRAICNSLRTVHWRRWEEKGFRAIEGATSTRLRRMYFDSKVWQRHLRLFRAAWSDDERVKIVRYEDLVRNPSAVFREIGEFLNEDFSDEVLASRSWSDVSAIPADSLSDRRGLWLRDHFERVLKPITEESIDKWRAGLTRLEIEVIESACAEGMRWLGYEKVEHPGATGSPSRLEIAAALFWGSLFWSIHEAWRKCRAALTGAHSELRPSW